MLDLITQGQIWRFLMEETAERKIGMVITSHSQELWITSAPDRSDLMCKRFGKEVKMDAREVLVKYKNGEMSLDEAELYFRREPFEELEYAKLDTHRKLRSGFAEVCSAAERQMRICFPFSKGSMRRKARCSAPGRRSSSTSW